MAVFGQNLGHARAAAIAQINQLAGMARQRYITTAPGQEMIYLAKEAEAVAYLAASVPNPPADLAAYPLLAAEIGVTAPTAWELAQVWVNTALIWRSIAAGMEGARMRAIAAIEAADNVAAINTTLHDFVAADLT
jgi:hypothetical protein